MPRSELNQLMAENERVAPDVRGKKRRDGFTQSQAVSMVLNLFDGNVPLAELQTLASQEYGRRITLGTVFNLRWKWQKDRAAKEALAVDA